MENLYDPASTVLSRTTYVFNKNDFSDVVLIVGEQQIQYPSHKLLLCLASPVFARNFKEIATSDNIVTLRVPDTDPDMFYKVLKYIYTDEIELNSVGEARDVRRFAENFQILALQQICKDYVKQHAILPENAIKIFETASASTLQMNDVQELCLYAFSEETISVFESAAFSGARQSTIEAILRIDTLAVGSEMDTLNATMKWSKAHCQANHLPIDTNLRVIIEPLLKHIRFLTIPLPDLQAFWKTYNNLMTSEEVCALTIALVKPDCSIAMPKSLCPNKNPRNASNHSKEENSKCSDSRSNVKDTIVLHNSDVLEETAVKQLNTQSLSIVTECIKGKINIVEKDMPMNSLSNVTKSISSTLTKSVNSLEYNSATRKLSEVETFVSKLKMQEENIAERQLFVPVPRVYPRNLPSSLKTNNLLSESAEIFAAEVHKLDSKTENLKGMKTIVRPQKTVSDSESEDENETSESDTEETITNCKAITIDLDESKEVPSGMRPADITSCVTINVVNGLIKLLGVKIQIKNIAIKTNYTHMIMVRIENEGENWEKIYNKHASSPFDLFFDEPVTVLANKKVKIIVSVEDLQLQQCCLFRLDSHFLCRDNRGNHFEIQVDGNQNVKGVGLPFLISRVLYSDHQP